MHVKKIADSVAALTNDTVLGSSGSLYERTKSWIREVVNLDILSTRADWWFLRKVGQVSGADEIAGGTVSLTKGSRTVTGSGTSFSSAINGRMLVTGGKAQRIATSGYSSSTSATLETEWEHDSVSGASFSIVKDRIALPRWIDPKKVVKVALKGYGDLTGISSNDMDIKYSARSSLGDPRRYAFTDRIRTNYSTGTVSGTVGAYTVNGSSTAWTSSSLEQGDILRIGSDAYTIKSVDGDTSITVYEAITSTFSASTYEADLDRFYIEVYPMPQSIKNFAVLATQAHPPLERDSDTLMFPDDFVDLVTKGVYIKALKHNQDPGYEGEYMEFLRGLKSLQNRNARDDYRTESWWR